MLNGPAASPQRQRCNFGIESCCHPDAGGIFFNSGPLFFLKLNAIKRDSSLRFAPF